MSKLHFEFTDQPAPEQIKPLIIGLRRHTALKVGEYSREEFMINAYDEASNLIGGMYGWFAWGWLYIDAAWVDEAQRGLGLGTKLLHRFEDHARKRGIHNVRLNTGSFQALGFYQKHGYEIFAELDIVAPDGSPQQDYFLKKQLSSSTQLA